MRIPPSVQSIDAGLPARRVGTARARLFAIAAAVAVGCAGGAASAAEPLAWSFAATGVGHCTSDTFTCSVASGTLEYVDLHNQHDFNFDAVSAASDPQWGLAHASANLGPGFGDLGLAQLHTDVTGTPFDAADYSWSYAVAQAVQGYTWTGGSYDLSIDAFEGLVDFTNSGFYGQVTASLAILADTQGQFGSWGDFWYLDDPDYGFLHSCADNHGAIGIGETGPVTTQGAVSTPLSVQSCGGSTFHLEDGDTFYLWARMRSFHLGDGFTDASHTFDVRISPNLDPEVATFITSNIRLAALPDDFGVGVPEPSSWALMILGFAGAGAALRRRSRALPAR